MILFGRSAGNAGRLAFDRAAQSAARSGPETLIGLNRAWRSGIRASNSAQVDGFKYAMSLPSWKRMVDFAAENNIRHLVLDADWYGPEFGKDSDPTKGGKVAQVREIIAYGQTKGVGVWLYLNDVDGPAVPTRADTPTIRRMGHRRCEVRFHAGPAGGEERADAADHGVVRPEPSALRFSRRPGPSVWPDAPRGRTRSPASSATPNWTPIASSSPRRL